MPLILPPDVQGRSICNVSPVLAMEANARLSQWPLGTVLTFGIVQAIRGFSMLDMQRLGEEAYRPWHEKSGLPPIRWTQDNTSANIVVGIRNIDRQFGVLAEAELPPPGASTANFQLRMWFDNRDDFVDSINPPSGKIPLIPVWKHENGHTLGLGHNMDGITNALMDPQLSRITDLQPWDIEQAQIRYGRPESTPPVIPPGGAVGKEEIAKDLERIAKWIRDNA